MLSKSIKGLRAPASWAIDRSAFDLTAVVATQPAFPAQRHPKLTRILHEHKSALPLLIHLLFVPPAHVHLLHAPCVLGIDNPSCGGRDGEL